MARSSTIFGSVVFALTLSACGGASGGAGSGLQGAQGGSGGSAAEPGAGNEPGTGGKPSSGGSLNIGGAPSGTGSGSGTCAAGNDVDQDGFTVADGDCNDCDPNANPGAYDVAGDGVDEDCDGVVDGESTECDAAITDVADNDPMSGAKAMGLCKVATATDRKWGVLEAKWVMADGSPGVNDLSHGMLNKFGSNVKVQEGKRMLGLSSGTARDPQDLGYQDVGGADMGTTSAPPAGFPMDSASCSGVFTQGSPANDPAGLMLKIRVPTNAKSFTYNFNFFTYEFPGWICTEYNDFFVALQQPAPPNAKFGNISFDSQGNPVSVNNGFLEACDPQSAGGKNFSCPLGPSLLAGTGFGQDGGYENHAATGWLETTSPVEPGSEITLLFTVFDEGDHILDTTTLLDNFKWSADEAKQGSNTQPVPNPK